MGFFLIFIQLLQVLQLHLQDIIQRRALHIPRQFTPHTRRTHSVKQERICLGQ